MKNLLADRLAGLASDFGPFPPVEGLLGSRSLQVIRTADSVKSFIIDRLRKPPFRSIAGYRILAKGPRLTNEQIQQLQRLILLPEAHYNGHPIFKRLPPIPNFAFQFKTRDSTLDMLIDLHNPGWEFHCDVESYSDWN